MIPFDSKTMVEMITMSVSLELKGLCKLIGRILNSNNL